MIFGDGLQTRDFVYVGDVVAALLAAAGHDGGGVFNVGSGVETTVLALHEACAAGGGRRRRSRRSSRRGSATCAARRSTSRAPRPSSASRAQTPLDDGPRRDLGLDDRAVAEGVRAAPAKSGAPWMRRSSRRTTWSGRGGGRPSSRASIAAIELVLLLVAGAMLVAKPLSHAIQQHAIATATATAPTPRRRRRSQQAIRRHARARRQRRARAADVQIMVFNGNGQVRRRRQRRRPARSTSATRSPAPPTRAARTTRRASSCTRPATAPRASGSRKDLGVKVVGPLDGIGRSALHGGELAVIVGA